MQLLNLTDRDKIGANSGDHDEDEHKPLRVTEALASELLKGLNRVRSERAQLKDKEADLLENLKSRGFTGPAIKLGLRLRRMEAKERDAEAFVDMALKMLASANDGSDDATAIEAVVDELDAIREERKELNGDKAALVATAVDHGIPPAALEIVMRMSAMDAPQRPEFFEALEAVADKLGWLQKVEY